MAQRQHRDRDVERQHQREQHRRVADRQADKQQHRSQQIGKAQPDSNDPPPPASRPVAEDDN